MGNVTRDYGFMRAFLKPVSRVLMKYTLVPYLVFIIVVETAVWIGFDRSYAFGVGRLFLWPIFFWVTVRYIIPVWLLLKQHKKDWPYDGAEKLEKELQHSADVLKYDLINLMRLFHAKN